MTVITCSRSDGNSARTILKKGKKIIYYRCTALGKHCVVRSCTFHWPPASLCSPAEAQVTQGPAKALQWTCSFHQRQVPSLAQVALIHQSYSELFLWQRLIKPVTRQQVLASKHLYAYINIVKLQQTISPTSPKAQHWLYILFWPDHNSLLCWVDDVPLSTSHTHLSGFSSVSFHRSSYKIQFQQHTIPSSTDSLTCGSCPETCFLMRPCGSAVLLFQAHKQPALFSGATNLSPNTVIIHKEVRRKERK